MTLTCFYDIINLNDHSYRWHLLIFMTLLLIYIVALKW